MYKSAYVDQLDKDITWQVFKNQKHDYVCDFKRFVLANALIFNSQYKSRRKNTDELKGYKFKLLLHNWQKKTGFFQSSDGRLEKCRPMMD